MAKRKKPYMVFETKEEFDEEFDKIFQIARTQGFKDGCVWVMSYIFDLFEGMFSQETLDAAALEKAQRNIETWRKASETNKQPWPGAKNWLDTRQKND